MRPTCRYRLPVCEPVHLDSCIAVQDLVLLGEVVSNEGWLRSRYGGEGHTWRMRAAIPVVEQGVIWRVPVSGGGLSLQNN